MVWLVLIAIGAPLGSKLKDVTKDETSSFLPSSAESTEVNHLLKDRFPGGQTVNGIVVYRRATGLTPADKRKMLADAPRSQAELPLIGKPAVPFQGPASKGLVSPDGRVAYTVLTFRDNYDKLGDWGKKLRQITGKGTLPGGLEVHVTGDAG